MNRRSFFSIAAAVVVAPKVLWEMVRRSRPNLFATMGENFRSLYGNRGLDFDPDRPPAPWKNYASTYTNVDRDEAIKKMRRAAADMEWEPPIAKLAREQMGTLRQELERLALPELTADGEPQFATQDEFFENRRIQQQHMRQTKGAPPRGINYWILNA